MSLSLLNDVNIALYKNVELNNGTVIITVFRHRPLPQPIRPPGLYLSIVLNCNILLRNTEYCLVGLMLAYSVV